MNKTDIKTQFYQLLSPLVNDGISVVGIGNEDFNKTPLVAYGVTGKYPILIQDRQERFTEWLFFIRIFANSSPECTGISDSIDSILKPIGFTELDFDDGFDKHSGKFVAKSLYSIRLDDNGVSYNLK